MKREANEEGMISGSQVKKMFQGEKGEVVLMGLDKVAKEPTIVCNITRSLENEGSSSTKWQE